MVVTVFKGDEQRSTFAWLGSLLQGQHQCGADVEEALLAAVSCPEDTGGQVGHIAQPAIGFAVSLMESSGAKAHELAKAVAGERSGIYCSSFGCSSVQALTLIFLSSHPIRPSHAIVRKVVTPLTMSVLGQQYGTRGAENSRDEVSPSISCVAHILCMLHPHWGSSNAAYCTRPVTEAITCVAHAQSLSSLLCYRQLPGSSAGRALGRAWNQHPAGSLRVSPQQAGPDSGPHTVEAAGHHSGRRHALRTPAGLPRPQQIWASVGPLRAASGVPSTLPHQTLAIKQ